MSFEEPVSAGDNGERLRRANNEGTTTMLDNVKTLQGYRLNSRDGEMGGSGTSTSMTGTGRSAIWSATQQTGCRAGRY